MSEHDTGECGGADYCYDCLKINLSTSESAREAVEDKLQNVAKQLESLRLQRAIDIMGLVEERDAERAEREKAENDYKAEVRQASHNLDMLADCVEERDSLRAELDSLKAKMGMMLRTAPDAVVRVVELESALASKAQEVEAMREALVKLQDLRWTAVVDGSGPSDCSPNEKGLYRFLGQMSDIVGKALSRLSEARKEMP